MLVNTRFAPSPTGYLHIGSVRTALYSWLFARNQGGKFILRIEDTDTERSTQESVEVILEGMRWLGLHEDEGPFYQTQRLEHYKMAAQQLLNQDKAYRCYCTKERLEQLRAQQIENKEKPRYDGHCRGLHLPERDEPFVIRFANPTHGEVRFEDYVRGVITVSNRELDDLVLVRSDGMPTYNFVVVVDDRDMKITHVIRGDDHINNTPRQINIMQALGCNTLPNYAHLPMILGPDGKRLSKRYGAANVLSYREEGYLPEALLNYLVRLGWSHGDQEIFTLDEMIRLFDLSNINKAASAINPEKLIWLNQHYLKTLDPEYIVEQLKPFYNEFEHVNLSQGPELVDIVLALREKVKTLKELAEKSVYFYQEELIYDEQAAATHLTQSILPLFTWLVAELSSIPLWDKQQIHASIEQAMQEFSLKMPKIAQPLRVAMTGDVVSPSIDLTLALMGREKVIKRLKKAIGFLEKVV